MGNNFQECLNKENDALAQAHLNLFYSTYYSEWNKQRINFDEGYGNYLQIAGVDTVLSKLNAYGGISEQLFYQEKVVFKKYDAILFEIEKKSGAKGWATNPREKADILLFQQIDDIYLFDFRKLSAYIREHHTEYKQIQTDNKNIIITKKELRQLHKAGEIAMIEFPHERIIADNLKKVS